MTNCKQCGAEVPQKQGKQAKVFCNDRCRMAFKRATPNKKEMATPNKPTPNTGKINPEHNPEQNAPNYPAGHCQGCDEKQPNDLCEICHKCITNGKTRESVGLPPTAHQVWLNECNK